MEEGRGPSSDTFSLCSDHRIKIAKNTSKVVIIFFELPLKAWGVSKTTRERKYI